MPRPSDVPEWAWEKAVRCWRNMGFVNEDAPPKETKK